MCFTPQQGPQADLTPMHTDSNNDNRTREFRGNMFILIATIFFWYESAGAENTYSSVAFCNRHGCCQTCRCHNTHMADIAIHEM